MRISDWSSDVCSSDLLESLTLWLSQQAGQPYLRIDPLKINVAAVTPLMSYAFAQRHKILAVAVDRDAVTVASAQPYVSSWEADLTHELGNTACRERVCQDG